MDLAVRGDAKVEAIRLADALAAIRTQLWPILDTEGVDISGARGRVLATDLVAKVNLPHWDSAAVDGFAVRGPDLVPDRINRLTVIGEAAAGHPFASDLGPGQAVRILTVLHFRGGPMLSLCRRYAASMAQISLWQSLRARACARRTSH